MAKAKGDRREFIALECGDCGERNYWTQKMTRGGTPRLELQKFCPRCRKHTSHKEKKK